MREDSVIANQSLGKERNRNGRGLTELVDSVSRSRITRSMGLWDELLLGAQHGEHEHLHKVPLRCCQDGSGFSVEGGFGEDDMARNSQGSTMLTPGHVRGFGVVADGRHMVKHRCREDFGRSTLSTGGTTPTSFYITCPWLIGPSPEWAMCYDMQCAELPTGKVGENVHLPCL